tara:strand:+ start:266 stop:637 length:372 start_codon:yes stop_codon:yes gene_type:complete
MSGKKPTMMQVKNVIDNMLRHVAMITDRLEKLDGLLDMYIDFKGDKDLFKGYVTKTITTKIKERENANKEKSGELRKGSETNRSTGNNKQAANKRQEKNVKSNKSTKKSTPIKDSGESGSIGL